MDELVKRLRDAATMSEALAVLLPHSEGNATAKLYNQAADAIEELKQYAELYKDGGEAAKKAAETYKAAYIAEHDARVAELPRWIPVTEQPPLKVGDDGYNGYLVYVNGYYEIADYTTDKFDNVPYFHVNGEYEPDVTHWMLLPQPPKEET